LKTNDRINAWFELRPPCVWRGGFGRWPHNAGLARLQRLVSTALRCLRRRRCQIFGGATIQFRLTAKMAQPSWLRLIFSSPYCVCQESSPNRQIYNSWGNVFEQFSLLTGAAIVLARFSSAWRGKRLIGSAAFFWHLCRFLCPRTGDLSWRYANLVRSGFRQVRYFGPLRQCFVRHSRLWLFLQSNRASRNSPADHDARKLWATRVGTVASFGFPQSYQLG